MKINAKNLHDFEEMMYDEAAKLFGTDEEGNSLVQIILVDRTRHGRLHYLPVPLTWPIGVGTLEAEDLKRRLMLNLQLAFGELDTWWKVESDENYERLTKQRDSAKLAKSDK